MKYNKENLIRFFIFSIQNHFAGKSFFRSIKEAYCAAFPKKIKFIKK